MRNKQSQLPTVSHAKPHSFPTPLIQGTCEGMCSPREREERQAQQDISPFEATDATRALRRHSMIIDPQVRTFLGGSGADDDFSRRGMQPCSHHFLDKIREL